MINAENVKYYDIVLSHILNSDWGQLGMKEVTKLCDGSEGLAEEIAEEFDRRELIIDLAKSKCREGTTLVLKSKGKAKLLEERGGFQAEYEKLHPPKSKAEKLNDHFYKIINEERLMRIEDYSDEIHSMNATLLKLGLIDETVSFFVPSKEGLLLSYSGKTVQDYIKKQSSSAPQPATVNNYNAPVIDRSSLNNSPVSSIITTNNNTPAAENNKRNWWIPIVVAVITALSVIGSKLLEVAN